MHIQWKTIDVDQWERKKIFHGFKDFDFPYSVVGTDVDVTQALKFWKKKELSPYLCLVYAVCRTANAIPAFRQRIRNDQVIEHEIVHADYTVPDGKESFAIRLVEYDSDIQTFLKNANTPETSGWGTPGTDLRENDHWIFMSTLPWVKFNHIVQPIDRRSGSIPRIVWGKFSQEGDRTVLPLSIQSHHSLVDGIHVAKFIEYFQDLLNHPEEFESKAP